MPDHASLKAELLTLLKAKSCLFGDFTLASGAKSDFYVDCRVTTMDARGAILIGQLGLKTLRDACTQLGASVSSVGGLTMGADPVALAIAIASGHEGPAVDAFAVRKTPKSHGRTKLIEGNFKEGDTVVVVDDVITTGGSTLTAIDSVEKEGGKVAFVIALVDRQEGGRANIEARGIPVFALATKEELRSA